MIFIVAPQWEQSSGSTSDNSLARAQSPRSAHKLRDRRLAVIRGHPPREMRLFHFL